MADEKAQRRLAAILAADVAGYSRMMGADEAGTLATLTRFWRECFDPFVADHRGRIVKMMGDGALVEFPSAVNAAECAVAIQSAAPGDDALSQIQLRIGVNLGDVLVADSDLFGDGVNVAARLEAAAPVGGVLISDALRAQIVGKCEISLTDAGALSLKNIAQPVRAWRWTKDGAEDAPPPLATTDSHPSIAVLPFKNMSGDPEQEYFADGLVEDIITALSKLSDLKVIARNSTFAFKGRSVDVRDIARQLGVRYVLEGSIRRGGDRIRITAQLIDAATGAHVWAERYDRALDDIFAVQDEITLVVATEMQVSLTEGEQARLRYRATKDVEAWTHWVRGLSLFRQTVTKENAVEIVACWNRALELDPSAASIHALIGLKHYGAARFGWWDDRETAIEKSRACALRALELDPENADGFITLSLVLLAEGKFDDAAEQAAQAVDLAPGSADVAAFACLVQAMSGRADEAARHGERALALSPLCPGYYFGQLGTAYRLSGRYDDAIRMFETYHDREPGFGLLDLVIVHHDRGDQERAAHAARRLLEHRRDFTIEAWAKTQFQADAQRLNADIAALRAAGLRES